MSVPGRWSFITVNESYTPDFVEEYVFPINPNAETNRVPSRGITWNYGRVEGYSGTRAPRQLHPWEFSGVVRSQAQYDAFVAWVNKKTWIAVLDDLGRVEIVRLIAFVPRQQGASRNVHAPWRFEYTMKGLIKP